MKVRFAVTLWSRLRGLLFRPASWLRDDEVLLIAPCNSIHTIGMSHAIDVAFLDDRGFVLSVRKGLEPFRLAKCRHASSVMERFCTTPEGSLEHAKSRWFEVGDWVDLEAK